MARAYYNEIDPYAAQWLRNLIAEGHIAPGDVDERDIRDVKPDDLQAYTQCHFFAGIGGWSYALRLAGWPDSEHVWTGSCPCQPFSQAGKRKGFADERHLWPIWRDLIAERKPSVVFGEQVANATLWLDRVCSDLEGIDYAFGAAIIPACSVDAPHKRDRLWFVADANESVESDRHVQRSGQFRGLERDSKNRIASPTVADPDSRNSFWWSGPLQVGWNSIAGKTAPGCDTPRTQWRVKPGLPLLAHGVHGRVDQLRAFGNAIVPQVAAQFVIAAREAISLRLSLSSGVFA